MTFVLEKKLTHKYVGTCDHLDDWFEVADADYIGNAVVDFNGDIDEEDATDPMTVIEMVRITNVRDGCTDEDIEQALADHFTKWGCHHEHDCCGCRNFSAGEIIKRDLHGEWLVFVHSSRNY